MHITNKYRKVDRDIASLDISEYLEKYYSLQIQPSKIEETLWKYVLVQRVEKKKAHFLYRITAPFLMLIVLLFLITKPLKWVITGDSHLSDEGKIYKFLKTWAFKAGIEI